MMEKKLYEWQKKCLQRWFANDGRGMVQAATGAGKTMLALAAVKRLEEMLNQEALSKDSRNQEIPAGEYKCFAGKRELYVRIVVPNGGLMQQWERALREFRSENTGGKMHSGELRRQIGLRGSGQKDSPEHKYMIYVINSARYELARQILTELREGKAVFLIADECHHYGSSQNRLIFEFLPYIEQYKENFFSMGLSATLPAGEDRRYLASVLGRRIYNYGITEASVQQTVCRYDIFHISVKFQDEELEEYQELSDSMVWLYRKLLQVYPALKGLNQRERFELLGRLAGDKRHRIAEPASKYMMLTYKRKQLVCLAAERLSCACGLVERLGIQEKIIIFGERICQADELYRLLQGNFPGRVGRYHSKMGNQANKNTLDRFRGGEFRILISCKAIDEGVDVPDASVGIILSGTSVQRQRVQRLGRIIRNREGKDGAALYYLHIEESSEDTCYLPELEESRSFELAYQKETGGFCNAVYDAAAEELLRKIADKGADEKLMEEMKRCLRLGSVRADWNREDGWIEEKMKGAENVRERNYWVCMKKLREVMSVSY